MNRLLLALGIAAAALAPVAGLTHIATRPAGRMPVRPRRRRGLGEAGRWREFQQVFTELTDPSDARRTWGNAAWIDPETREGVCIHVTDNSDRVLDVLRSGKPIAETRDLDKYGDIGPGLYCSAVPQMWMGRSTGKWSFLDRLTRPERVRVARAVLRHRHLKERGYLTRSEKQRAARDLRRWVNAGSGYVAYIADQPYNVRFWEPKFLAPLGIEPAKQPAEVEVRFAGRFLKLPGHMSPPEVQEIVEQAPVDGAFVADAWSSDPQLVIWNNRAVKQFGPYRR